MNKEGLKLLELESIDAPLGIVGYKESGRENISRGPYQLSFEYSKAERDKLDPRVARKVAQDPAWRKLDSLELSRLGRDYQFRLEAVLPPGWQVFFNPSTDVQSFSNPEVKTCFVGGDLAQPSTLIGLLHEIGHGWDYERHAENISPKEFMEAHERLFAEKELSADELEQVLRIERNAWAYALRAVKPLLAGPGETGEDYSITKDDVKRHIHHSCLSGYSRANRERVETGIINQLL